MATAWAGTRERGVGWRGMRRRSSSTPRNGKPGEAPDGEDLVVAAAVQVDQLVAREPGRLADGGEVLAVVAHGDAHEVAADVAAARARLLDMARQPVVDRRALGARASYST